MTTISDAVQRRSQELEKRRAEQMGRLESMAGETPPPSDEKHEVEIPLTGDCEKHQERVNVVLATTIVDVEILKTLKGIEGTLKNIDKMLALAVVFIPAMDKDGKLIISDSKEKEVPIESPQPIAPAVDPAPE